MAGPTLDWRPPIDLIEKIDIILETGMDWMSNVMVKKIDIWTQLVPFCWLGHIQSLCCHSNTSWPHFVNLVAPNHHFVTIAPAGHILSTWSQDHSQFGLQSNDRKSRIKHWTPKSRIDLQDQSALNPKLFFTLFEYMRPLDHLTNLLSVWSYLYILINWQDH
jgi:hypothetical protein